MANGFDFNDKLRAATLIPLVIVILVMLVRYVHGHLIKGEPILEGTAVKYMFLMLYFGIATISSIIAKAFQCTEFIASDDDGGTVIEEFLTAGG